MVIAVVDPEKFGARWISRYNVAPRSTYGSDLSRQLESEPNVSMLQRGNAEN